MSETSSIRRVLREAIRDETVGGVLIIAAAAAAMIWANSPWSASYEALSDTTVGPEALHLNLTLAEWAADGLLAVFFFVAGLELKYELVLGSLRKRSTAVVPIAAAVGGMVVPALIYVAFNRGSDGELSGWGIPMATDIAFALAVLAVAGRRMPVEARIFLLTLAVVDDLGAILVIALFYTAAVALLPLLGAAAACGLYAYAQHRRVRSPWLYLLLAAVVWVLLHSSGIHATVAGIALGLLTRVRADPGEEASPAERWEDKIHPISAGICVPLFAFFAAGVTITGNPLAFGPVSAGIAAGLVIGKPLGIVAGALAATRFAGGTLPALVRWADIAVIGIVAGVGFTVSLLITELAFSSDAQLEDDAKLAVLGASVFAAVLASIALQMRGRRRPGSESLV